MGNMSGKPVLMVIDDSVMMNVLLYDIFDERFQVDVFENGLDALRWLHEGNIPDIIISDFYLPSISGFDFLVQIKSSSLFSHIPVIILSGEESSTIRVLCLESGADDFIVKPFSPPELRARVNLALNRCRPSGNYMTNREQESVRTA
jgi:DNA-binding response OmpR family regulator